MANLKATVKNDFVKESGKANIKIRISHDGKTRYIKTQWDINPKYMNTDGSINSKYPGQAKLNMAINLLLAEYNGILENIGKDIIFMDINTIVSKLKRNQGEGEGMIRYMNERIKVLKQERRISYAGTFEATIKKLEAFSGKKEILFKEVNLDFLQRFNRWLLKQEKKVNTARIYINCIKNTLNSARDNDVIKMDLAFLRKFKVKKETVDKRNLSVEQIKILLSQSLSPARQRALDLFMLSFYLSGANFKDMLFWTYANIKDGRINYLRFKTKAKKPIQISVLITPEAQRLLGKYKGEKYLLRFIEGKNLNRKTEAYKDITRDTNVLLKKICKQAKLDIPKFGTYHARGSVGTIAYKLGIMESTISEMLGHSTGNEMTNTYIERDYTKIDQAQKIIINALN